MDYVIRKFDNYNFNVCKIGPKPWYKIINKKKVCTKYIPFNAFYGDLYSALIGLFKHSRYKSININPKLNNLKTINPTSDEKLFKYYLNKNTDKLKIKVLLK